MAEQRLEMSSEVSEGITLGDVLTELQRLQDENRDIMENLKLNAAVCVVLLEQAGGKAEFTPEELQSIDLSKQNVTLTLDDESGKYVLEGIYTDDESE